MASEKAVKEMEARAAMQKRMNKAVADLAANSNTEATRRAALEQGAHERFMQSRRNFIERNPNAVSPFERKAVLGDHQARQDQAVLREHEIGMADRKIAGEIAIAGKKAEGMANQGRAAAEIGAKSDMHRTDIGLKQHELEMANRKDIAGIQSETQKSISAGQNQTTLENTKLQGENAVKQQSEANKGLLAQGELKEKMEREKRAAQTRLKMLDLQTESGIALDKESASIVRKALDERDIDETEEDVINRLRKIYKNNPALLKFLGGAGGNSGGTNRFKD